MRSLSLLVLLLGAAASHPFFPAGREYEFDYEGKIMSGIPELDSHFAGLVLKGRVIVQAKDARTFKLAMKEVRFSKFNERLSGPEPQNWRSLETPEPQAVPAEYESMLKTPVEFEMEQGEVRKIRITGNEPEWVVNFKKSLVSLMKIQISSQKDLTQNVIRSDMPRFWKVMEEGIDGECENRYQVTELPEHMLPELTPSKLVTYERCHGRKIFSITKTRDVGKCVARTSFHFKRPGSYACTGGNCGTMYQRSSQTIYIGCGNSVEDLELQVIVNEGEIQQSLLGFKTENFVTGTRQIFRVIEVRDSLSSLPEISSPREIEDLLFEYPLPEGEKVASFRERQEKMREVSLTSNKISVLTSMDRNLLAKVSPATLKVKIMNKIRKLTEDIREVEQFEKKEVASNVLTVSKLITILGTEELKAIYDELKSNEIARQFFLETTLITGSNPSIMFLKKLIESGEMSPIRMGATIAMIPHYVIAPTVKLMDELFGLIQSPMVQKHETLKVNAHLAFATLLNRVCVDPLRARRFPMFVYGEFCNSETSELTTKYIPYLVNAVESSRTPKERVPAIVALGAIGHESVIPVLMPYIEGKHDATPLEQRMAIYSLNEVSEQHRNILMPVYSSLVFNPSEERNVRIAALSMMLYMQPSIVTFQKLATSTWFEKDTEFHKFVFSTLKSLAVIQRSEHPSSQTSLFHNSHKARVVLPLAKPVPVRMSSALNYFTADFLKDLEIGYHAHGAYSVGSHRQTVYGKLEYFFEQLKFTPIELCAFVKGTDEVVEEITKMFGVKKESHPEWEQLKSATQLKSEEMTSFGTGFWARLFDDTQVMLGIGSDDIKPILKSAEQAIKDPLSLKSKLCGKTPINFVKVNNWAPNQILVPSDMGLPVFIEVHMPAVLAVKGELEIDCSEMIPKVAFEVAHKASVAFTGYQGTFCPFTHELLATGVNEHWSVNYPTKVTAHLKMGKLNIVYSKPEELKSTKAVDLWAYTIKPFASIKPMVYLDETPLVQHENTKIIRSLGERKTKEFKYGRPLGLDMTLRMETESDINDGKAIADYFALYKYSPINTLLFSWTSTAITRDGLPSNRYHDVRLVYNPAESETKRVEVDLTMTVAYKSKSQQQVQQLALGAEQVKGVAQQLQQALQQAVQQQNKQQLKHQLQNIMIQQAQPLQQLEQPLVKQALEKHFQKLEAEQGFGITTKLEINLEGGAPKKYTYISTAGLGSKGTEHKWNLHVENNENLNICIDGSATTPVVSLRHEQPRDIRYFYRNNIGFGQTCEENKIKVTGTTQVSREQKEESRRSEEAKITKELTRKIEALKDQLKNAQYETSEYRRVEQELIAHVQKKAEAQVERTRQATTLDEVKFKIEYTPMPEYVRKYLRIVDTTVKGALYPYMTGMEQRNIENEIDVELKFNPKYNTVDMELVNEEGTVHYNDIRLPERMRNVLPLITSVNGVEEIINKVSEQDVRSKCRIGDHVVKTFDGKSFTYKLDDCYHILSAESSEYLRSYEYAILAKEVEEEKKIVKVIISGSKITMRPSSSYSESNKDYDVEIDGKQIEIRKDEKKEILTKSEDITLVLSRTHDDVLILETPLSKIYHSGKTVTIKSTKIMQGSLKGLCGNSNGDKRDEILSAQSCVVRSPVAAALSLRVQDSQCSQPSQEQQQILREESQCQKPKVVKTSVSAISKLKADKCTQMKHSMIKQGDRLCISQMQLVECGSGCSPRSLSEKAVPYVCLPANRPRVAELYEEKIRRGDNLPELKNMDKSFTAHMALPVSCVHPGL